MKKSRASALALLLTGVLVAAGCGDDGDENPAARAPSPSGAAMEKDAGGAAAKDGETATKNEGGAARPRGTTITLADSQFGEMLFDAKRQAIYVFERDRTRKSVCYGECAEAWPPVFTNGRPRAGDGVRASLLGTTRRRDGRLQVTYARKPLYFYANEKPGEVKCHNVELNGGFWWVVGPNGRRRA
jgi:predicted lipoprotein with Yx(FWY)xxD motif